MKIFVINKLVGGCKFFEDNSWYLKPNISFNRFKVNLPYKENCMELITSTAARK